MLGFLVGPNDGVTVANAGGLLVGSGDGSKVRGTVIMFGVGFVVGLGEGPAEAAYVGFVK